MMSVHHVVSDIYCTYPVYQSLCFVLGKQVIPVPVAILSQLKGYCDAIADDLFD